MLALNKTSLTRRIFMSNTPDCKWQHVFWMNFNTSLNSYSNILVSGLPLRKTAESYDSNGDIPTKERWKIESAKRFFEALRQQGTPVEFHTKLNHDSLAQIIHQIGL